MKNYSLSPVSFSLPGSQYDVIRDNFVAAGTVFEDGYLDDNGKKIGKGIHVMRMADKWNAAGIFFNSGNPYNPYGNTDWLFDDPNYEDERAVSIVPYNDDQSVVVAQVRERNERDKIKIMIVNHFDGTIVKDKIIRYGTPGKDDNIYACHALIKDDKLYICGYVTLDNSSIPYYPDFSNDKMIMIMQYDLVSDIAIAYGYSYYPPGGSTLDYDFDMALRMKLLNNGSNAGKLLVMGSCNGTYGPSLTKKGSSSWAMILPTPSLWPPIDISVSGEDISTEKYEYAFDAVEDDGGNLFLFSNKFIFNPGPNLQGFDLKPTFPVVSYLTYSLTAPPTSYLATYFGRIRINRNYSSSQTNWAWGTSVLPNTAAGPGGMELTLAGLLSDWDNTCSLSGNPAPSNTNVVPLLHSMALSHNATNGVGINTYYWKTYLTQNSTPSYYTLGGGLSNIAWSTVNANNNFGPGSDNAFFAPWQNVFGTSKLYLKISRTDANGNIDPGSYNCENTVTDCDQHTESYSKISYGLFPRYDRGLVTDIIEGNSSHISPFFTESSIDCQNHGYYKTTTAKNILTTRNINFSIFPNPTNEFLSFHITGDTNVSELNVDIVNLQGQIVQKLYEGDFESFKKIKKFELKNLVAGLYIVKISSNNIEISQQKFSVY